mmetsp:Transcript_30276/g.34513  ORF Transcript_30276/g.34513 Transcript_30276/m.34513 type:complete len:269 (-) Transcript_30276:99-905(-)|eukprot:CAMPEP_0194143906 /NCGR_PEP_ID=MMETSP0152-20130528/13005_1 /TAXON_ID=1049557 /ORGANISM="Thalassiothrix antarctica, Strain L6-D1" /LENGTH=268 /DNA_ID=CAMNT_0038843515 /DNA_START=115 /DNA_END=921 /DNA_ORIENTATION=+
MSSLRNAVKRITHKERSQPRARASLGLLEKKKDYKIRAKDFHKKEDLIQAMKQRASMRNPDEFYFGMKNTQINEYGKHVKTDRALQDERKDDLDPEAIRIMKDQDLSYIRMQKQKDLKKMERLSKNLHFIENNDDDEQPRGKGKHTVFVNTQEEAQNFNEADHFDTVPELTGRSFNRIRKADLIKEAAATTKKSSIKDQKRLNKKLAKARSSAYRELEGRKKRLKILALAEAHLVTEKLLASKGTKRKIKAKENGHPAQYIWKRKRLR